MSGLYESGSFNYTGRVDGVKHEQLRWHQVIKNIDIDKADNYAKGFCIIGFKSDLGVAKNKGRVGAKDAPDAVRGHLASMPWHFGNIKLFDAGNAICRDNLEEAQDMLSQKVKKIADNGLFPIVIGGGHESAAGTIGGIYKSKKRMPSIVNFDAHFDMRDYKNGATSGTSFKQIGDICKRNSEKFDYLCIGIQKSSNTIELFNTAKDYKARWIDMDMVRFNKKTAMKKLDEFVGGSDSIHLSVCMDVFAQSIAPGVSAPQPFGLFLDEFLKFFYYITASGKVKSFDVAEVSPPLDLSSATSALAAHIIFRLVDKISQEPNYL